MIVCLKQTTMVGSIVWKNKLPRAQEEDQCAVNMRLPSNHAAAVLQASIVFH